MPDGGFSPFKEVAAYSRLESRVYAAKIINNEDVKSGKIAVGKIDDEQSNVTVVYTNKVHQKLPETGGDGVSWFYTAGIGCMLSCIILMCLKEKSIHRLQQI